MPQVSKKAVMPQTPQPSFPGKRDHSKNDRAVPLSPSCRTCSGIQRCSRATAYVARHHVGPRNKSGVTAAFAKVSTSRSSEEHTSELQSLMRISYAVFCLKK